VVFDWKRPLFKINPQEAGQYLDSIAQRDGGIKPNVIVEEARGPEALLHSCFVWDDIEAAQKYRVDQARSIIRNLVVVYASEDNRNEPSRTRAFVHVVTQVDGEDKDSRYLDIKTVLNDTQMRSDLLEQAKRELISFKTKYEGFMELAEIMGVIGKLFVA
jgi:hypothetical protein